MTIILFFLSSPALLEFLNQNDTKAFKVLIAIDVTIKEKADPIKDFCIKRIYANGQTANQCGNPHYDDGDMTFIYYPNPDWKLEDQGHLIFLKSDDEVSNVVTYKSNRAILFSSSIKHYSDAPHRLFSGLRISLAYKLLWN